MVQVRYQVQVLGTGRTRYRRGTVQGGPCSDLPVHFGLSKNTTEQKMQAILVTLDKSTTWIQHDVLLQDRSRKIGRDERGEEEGSEGGRGSH